MFLNQTIQSNIHIKLPKCSFSKLKIYSKFTVNVILYKIASSDGLELFLKHEKGIVINLCKICFHKWKAFKYLSDD